MSATNQSSRHLRERSERLKEVAAGTAMGRYLRYFWHPIATVSSLTDWPVQKVRLLGEDLALYRLDDGALGLVADRCAHRGASLSCGMTDGSNLRCAYHGWAYAKDGQCTDTPAEPATSTLRNRIKIAGYTVQAMGGLVWAYLGEQPAPLLPRFEALADEDRERSCDVSELPCSWLACVDNSMDPVHLEHLHMRYLNWVRGKKGQPPIPARRHVKIDFKPFEFGILKRRLWEGETEESEEWRVGHPLLFPSTLMIRLSPTWIQMQFRVPVDEEHTKIFWYDSRVPNEQKDTSELSVGLNPWADDTGNFIMDAVNPQDMMMWITQGPSPDHEAEHLGESDRGIALYRRILHEQLERVEQGEDPLGIVRDPARNTPYVQLPLEDAIQYTLEGVASGSRYQFPEQPSVALSS